MADLIETKILVSAVARSVTNWRGTKKSSENINLWQFGGGGGDGGGHGECSSRTLKMFQPNVMGEQKLRYEVVALWRTVLT